MTGLKRQTNDAPRPHVQVVTESARSEHDTALAIQRGNISNRHQSAPLTSALRATQQIPTQLSGSRDPADSHQCKGPAGLAALPNQYA